ncbi:unnamed protein product [Heligmosomoides polygyrus]|uniref:Uncharacterized protein n=1 Tax=Heligmosomoides polygyrus TaxID=6339 RepID=A0A183FP14_HELPZ|nr:unnamed protein product [Heligmosomoides polygyrus]
MRRRRQIGEIWEEPLFAAHGQFFEQAKGGHERGGGRCALFKCFLIKFHCSMAEMEMSANFGMEGYKGGERSVGRCCQKPEQANRCGKRRR